MSRLLHCIKWAYAQVSNIRGKQYNRWQTQASKEAHNSFQAPKSTSATHFLHKNSTSPCWMVNHILWKQRDDFKSNFWFGLRDLLYEGKCHKACPGMPKPLHALKWALYLINWRPAALTWNWVSVLYSEYISTKKLGSCIVQPAVKSCIPATAALLDDDLGRSATAGTPLSVQGLIHRVL